MKNETIAQWEAAVEKVSPTAQDKLRSYNYRVAMAVIEHMMFYSFFRYMVLRPLMFIVQVRNWIDATWIKSPATVANVERLESKSLEKDARSFSAAPA